MSENHTIIKIFVASPSGLDKERKAIWESIENINRRNSSQWLLQFKAIGWEDTVGGNRRAQDIINRDLETCDYFFGIMADHWGSPPYPSENVETKYTSGFHEEYELAQKMYQSEKMADIFLYFKKIPEDRKRDAGPSLRKVLEFREQVRDNRRPLYIEFDELDDFKNKIYDALSNIGWKRTTSNPSSAISSAPSDQIGEFFESESVTHSEPKKFLLPQSTREFLKVIQNKSGEVGTLSNVEVAQLRLISASTHRAGNDGPIIGVHDANLLYLFRSDLDLSHAEKTTLLTAGLRYMENQNVPFWYWTDGDLTRAERLVQFKMIATDDSIASSALKIAEIFGYRPPSISNKYDQGYWIKRWFENERTYKLGNAVESYLSKWAEDTDIPVLQKIGEGKSGLQSANLDCIIVGIKFRRSETEGFRELNERDPEHISVELQTILQDRIKCQTSDALEGLAKGKADYLRLVSIRELARRDALSEELAEELSGDNSIDVRLEAVKALVDKGKHISKSQAKEALVFKKSGLGDVFSGAKGTDDNSKFKDYQRHVLSKKSLDELHAMDEQSNPLDAGALLMACRVFPKRTEKLLRSLLKDGFRNRFENRMAGSKLLSSSQGAELVNSVRNMKELCCRRQTQEALEILVIQMKRKDLNLVREVIDRQEFEASEGVHQYLGRFGNWEDIDRILKLGNKDDSRSTLLGSNYTKVKVDDSMSQALAKIGRERFVDLLERLQTHALLHGTIKSVSGRAFTQLSDEKLLELMHLEDEDVRKVTALKCLQILPKSRIKRLLENYLKKEKQYYNVIHWLDLGSTMPIPYFQKIVRSELKNI